MTPLVLTIHDLKTQFEIVSATAVLECAGNGRALHPLPYDGLPWGLGAVGCARWTGVRLADVLAAAGLRQEAVYVGFQSPDVVPTEPPRPALSRGLPIAKAMAQETLLCFAMNDEPLPFLHGGPLRVVAPGFPGSAWQKWLTRIWVRDVEHDGEKMTGTDYRLPRHPIQPGDNLDQVAFDVLTDMPVRSMITSHAPDFITAAGRDTEWRGFAWGGHTPVAGVELSTDGGLTWHPSELEPASEPFAWRRFRLVTRPLAGPVHLVCRARNMAGQVQPLDHAPWNPRGYCNNVVHRINGTAQ